MKLENNASQLLGRSLVNTKSGGGGGGGNWLCLRPFLKAFSVFNVLKTCTEYFLSIDLEIVEFIKKFIERFLEKCEIFRHGPNYVQKLYECKLIKFFLLAIA